MLLAWPDSSPLEPTNGGHPNGESSYSWIFLALLIAAFVAYVAAILLARVRAPRLAAAWVLACAIQLAPLAAPLLLSTDAWTYWDFGRIATVHNANPYRSTPSDFRHDPAFPYVGKAWRHTTTVYGPAFTLASQPLARAAGTSHAAAAWIYKSIAALAVLGAAAFASRLSRRPALALLFVAWNPVLAVHFGGGGHNDAWIALLVLAALGAAASGRRQLAGVSWATAALVKWVPLVLLPLRALEARATERRVAHLGFAIAAAVIAGAAFVAYGTGWIHAFGPLARNANHETRWSLPHRLQQLGVPHGVAIALFALAFAVAYLWLAREAWRGRARLGLATCALLLALPYLVVWYVVWAIPLAAAEDDEAAGLLALVICGYLLRQTIPLY